MEYLYNGFHKISKTEMPNGAIREKLHLAHAVSILLIDKVGRFAMVEQYRAPIGKKVLEIPAGIIDKNLTKEGIILEEVMEECGFSSEMINKIKLKQLSDEIYAMIGSSDTTNTLYVGYYDGVGEDKEITDDDVGKVIWKDLKENLHSFKDVNHDMKSYLATMIFGNKLMENNVSVENLATLFE